MEVKLLVNHVLRSLEVLMMNTNFIETIEKLFFLSALHLTVEYTARIVVSTRSVLLFISRTMKFLMILIKNCYALFFQEALRTN